MIISNGTALGFAPQALGETVPNLANGYFYARTGVDLLGHFATYAALYRAQPSVATVVDKVSAAGARLTVKVWDTTKASGRVQDTTSPLASLMANPCVEMSPFAFWRWTFSTYEVYGEAFWYKQREKSWVDGDGVRRQSGDVVTLLPMHPSRTAVHRDPAGNVIYVFTLGVASAGILRAPSEDVVPFLRYNPDMLMRGLSRLEPLRQTLRNEDSARRANDSFWNRGARPGLALTTPGKLSQPAQERLRAQFDAMHAGADNVGSTMVLEEGLTAVPLQLNAEEMQYIESRKLNLQEVCMVYDVPPPVVHILDHATYSNITEQMRSMYRDTMSPRLEDVESVIDWAVRSEFFPAGQREVEFDMSEVLRGDYETRVDKAQVLRQTGLATGNEGRDLVGLPRSSDPEMDKLYANAALVPLGTPAQRVSITEQANPDPALAAEAQRTAEGADEAGADAQAAKSAPVFRAAMGAVGRAKAAGASKADLRKTMIDQHSRELGKFFDRQHAAVSAAVSQKAPGAFDPTAWDGDLASILHSLSLATAQAIGAKVAADLGGAYSSDEITSWLASNSADTAKKVNQATADEIAAALEAAADGTDTGDVVDQVFSGEVAARQSQISMSRVAMVAGLASLVAARQSKARTKTWVTGPNPRSTHAEMSGETVPLGEKFSNGMDGPGDYAGGADEVANCNCDLDFGME